MNSNAKDKQTSGELVSRGKSGDTDRLLFLARAYADPKNPGWNEQEAVHYYLAAANGGHPDAQYELGNAYAEGKLGLTADKVEALKWFKCSDFGGNPNARLRAEQLRSSLGVSEIEDSEFRARILNEDRGLAGVFRDYLKNISITSLAAGLLGYIYLCGYVIHSIYSRSLGIDSLSFVRAHFLETGAAFVVLTLALMFIPFTLFIVVREVRRLRDLSPEGAKRQTLISLNFCLVLLFFALFITSAEVDLSVYKSHWVDWDLKEFFLAYLWIVLVGLVSSVQLEKLWRHTLRAKWEKENKDDPWIKKGDDIVSNGLGWLRWTLLIYSVFVDVILLVKIHWIWPAVREFVGYFVPIMALAFIIYRLVNLAKLATSKKSLFRLVAVALVFIICLHYLILTAFAYTVYRWVPMSRGGRMPVVTTEFYLSPEKQNAYEGIVATSSTNVCITVPLYVLEQNDEIFGVCTNLVVKGPLSSMDVRTIKRADVLSMRFHGVDPRANIR